MNTCVQCGAPLAPEARFCPRCGTPVAIAPPAAETPAAAPPPPAIPPPVIPPPVQAAPAAHAAPPPQAAAPPPAAPVPPRATGPSYTPVKPQPGKRSTWWIVPLVIVGVVVIAWLLLAGLPFGGREEGAENDAPVSETIAEGTTTAQGQPMTGTLIEVPGVDSPDNDTGGSPMDDDTATMAPISPRPVPEQPRVVEETPRQETPPRTTPAPPARATPAPARTTPPPARTTPAPAPTPRPAEPRPVPQQPRPAPSTPAPAPVQTGEISESEAGSTLHGYISSRNYYDGVSGNCLSIRSHGYRNVGYTFSVWDGCVSGGGSRMLGRWRVDSKTREVFRQREDGRFLRP